MPNKNRNSEHMRGKWSQDQLTAALEAIQNGTSLRQASIKNNISRKTLERRFKSGNAIKNRMGPTCTIGFLFTRDDLRTLAYNFVNQLKIKHKFNNDIEKAGYDWFYSFLFRHPDISVRKSESLSLARSLYISRQKNWFLNLSDASIPSDTHFLQLRENFALPCSNRKKITFELIKNIEH
ncbi:hypothetical protein P5V15_010041 [Pogonomyrmex californicus]